MKRLLAVMFLVAACDAGPTVDPAAVPGELVITLHTQGPALGAIRFKVRGGDIAQVTASDPGVTVFTNTNGDETSVVAIGETLQGALVRLRVPDVRKVTRYRTEIVELVDTENGKISVSEDYGLVVTR